MRKTLKRFIFALATSVLAVSIIAPLPAQAGDGVLYIASDYLEGYDRTLFKLWVDANKNGCDTRAEVLIKEAVVKPKKGAKCKLTGGKWISSYDGITYTDSSKLDIDHLVPLAEAWRSGAWAWTDKERENYANFLENDMALNAVTASLNRSKGDKDIANWLPKKNVCQYLIGWVSVKAFFNLTVDAAEAKIINSNYSTCGLGHITKESTIPIKRLQMPTPPTPIITYEEILIDKVPYLNATISITNSKDIDSLTNNFNPTSIFIGFFITSKNDLTKPGVLSCTQGASANPIMGVYSPYPVNNEIFIFSQTNQDYIQCRLIADRVYRISYKYQAIDSKKASFDVFEKYSSELEIVGSFAVIIPTSGSGTKTSLTPTFQTFPNRVSDSEFTFSSCVSDNAAPCDPKPPVIVSCSAGTLNTQSVVSVSERPYTAYYKFSYCTNSGPLYVAIPGAFCAPAGAIGKNSSGVIYTCKTSATDTRNRWRQ